MDYNFSNSLFFFLAIIWISPISGIFCQNHLAPFNEINRQNGLSALQNAFITQDADYFTWISSVNGLNRFDGKNVTIYSPKTAEGVVDPIITSKVMEAPNGDLWFSSVGGLHRITKGSKESTAFFIDSTQLEEAKEGTYYAFHLEADSLIWVIVNNHLFHFNIKTTQFKKIHPLTVQRCFVIEDSLDRVVGLVVSNFHEKYGIQLILYKEDSIQSYNLFGEEGTMELPLARVYHLFVENDSTIWLPSNLGLIKFNPNSFEFTIFKPQNPFRAFVDIAPTKDHLFWLACNGSGLHLFSKKQKKFIFQQKEIRLKDQYVDISQINNIFISESEDLFLSVWDQGVYFTNLNNRKFQHYLSAGLGKTNLQNIVNTCPTGENKILANVNNTKIVSLDLSSSPSVKEFFYQPKLRINHIAYDSSENIWIAANKEYGFIDPLTGQYNIVLQEENYFFKTVVIEPNLLMVHSSNGLFLLEKKGTKFIKKTIYLAGIEVSEIVNVYKGNNREFFISLSDQSLLVVSSPNFEIIDRKKQIGFVNDLACSTTGDTVWLASSRGLVEINLIQQPGIKFLSQINQNLKRTFQGIQIDQEKVIWLSSHNGIFAYDILHKTIKNYTPSDGLQGYQFSLGSSSRVNDEKLVFGGTNGLNVFDPKLIVDNPKEPVIQLVDLYINDNQDSPISNPNNKKKLNFTFDKNTLSFYFSAIDYAAPDENQYKYFMAGYDKDTVVNGTEGFVRYPNLPAGEYTLNVWASNSDNVWTKDPKKFQIKISPPWYQTLWFKALIILTILGIFYAIYRYRIYQIQKEANYKQLVAETETAVLRLQMNPHFIFNSMNSISSFIIEKDLESAHDFLARFGRLMRKILNTSEKQYHSISEEIELLTQYMDIEKKRFRVPFQYDIKIEQIRDTDEVLIPTMILQPFVENAIWHGIARNPQSGKISIGFCIEHNYLKCTIEDNGIGRKNAVKNQLKEHESKAILITQKRLNLLINSGTNNTLPNLNIIDLYEGNKAVGTRVILKIPLMD